MANEMNQRANAQIDALLNNTTNGYIQVNRTGRVTKSNDIMLEALECSRDALVGRPLQEVIPGLEKDVIDNVLAGGNSYSTFLHIRYQAMVAILAPIRLEGWPGGRGNPFLHKVHRSIQLDPRAEDGELLQGSLTQHTFDNVHHRSAAMAKAVDQARLFSQSNAPILLAGPQGLEVSLLAQCIHNNSTTRTGPFVQLNCASLEPEDQMTALFGTGYKNKDGEVDLGVLGMAENGTLLLQEVDKLSHTVQSNIYQAVRYHRVIQRNLERPVHVNTRIIVTSEGDLYALACEGAFRMDLYYLLAGLRIDLPPLKKRPEDLEDMLQATFQRLCENLRRYHVITNGGMELLKSLDWPGNIIQINAFLERLVLTARHRSMMKPPSAACTMRCSPRWPARQASPPHPGRAGKASGFWRRWSATTETGPSPRRSWASAPPPCGARSKSWALRSEKSTAFQSRSAVLFAGEMQVSVSA